MEYCDKLFLVHLQSWIQMTVKFWIAKIQFEKKRKHKSDHKRILNAITIFVNIFSVT